MQARLQKATRPHWGRGRRKRCCVPRPVHLSLCLSFCLSFPPSLAALHWLAATLFFLSDWWGHWEMWSAFTALLESLLSLSLPFSCSLPHLHGQDEDVDRAAGLQLAAGQCRLSLRGGETQRETHRNSPVTNYFTSTNIPCSVSINMRSEKLHVE